MALPHHLNVGRTNCLPTEWLVLLTILILGQVGPLSAADTSADSSSLDNSQTTDYFAMNLEQLTAIRVTVSSHDALDVFATPSTVTVISREMIDQYHFITVAEALSYVAGLEVYQTIIDRNVTTARGVLQNFYANKVLLLINNTPTWQPIYGEGSVDRINLQDVERIEVLKGPASVMYGSNAYSGVINIVLRDRDHSGGAAYGRLGAPSAFGAGVNFTHHGGGWETFFSINASHETRSPYTMTGAEGQPFQGSLEFEMTEKEETGSFNFQARYGDHTLLVNGFRHEHTFLGAGPSYVSGGGEMVDNKGILAAYRYENRLNQKTRIKGSLSFDLYHRDFPISIDHTNQIVLAGDRALAELVGITQLSDLLRLELGATAENRHSRGHNTRNAVTDTDVRDNMPGAGNVLEWSGFTQLNFDFKRVDLLLGTRYTKTDDFGDNVSSRVSAVVELGERRSLKAIWGQSFRAPTMFELYFDHPTVVGNPGLVPEKSSSWELAYLASHGPVYYQVLGFYAQYEQLIQRVTPATGPPSVYQNGNSFDGRGIEVETRFQSRATNGFINYTYLDGVGDAAESNFQFVADHSVKLGMNQHFRDFSIGFLGKVLSSVEGHLDTIEAQYLLDLNFGWVQDVGELSLHHAVILKNVTGSDMLIAEYIRQTPNINSLASTGFGRSLVYYVTVEF